LGGVFWGGGDVLGLFLWDIYRTRLFFWGGRGFFDMGCSGDILF